MNQYGFILQRVCRKRLASRRVCNSFVNSSSSTDRKILKEHTVLETASTGYQYSTSARVKHRSMGRALLPIGFAGLKIISSRAAVQYSQHFKPRFHYHFIRNLATRPKYDLPRKQYRSYVLRNQPAGQRKSIRAPGNYKSTLLVPPVARPANNPESTSSGNLLAAEHSRYVRGNINQNAPDGTEATMPDIGRETINATLSARTALFIDFAETLARQLRYIEKLLPAGTIVRHLVYQSPSIPE